MAVEIDSVICDWGQVMPAVRNRNEVLHDDNQLPTIISYLMLSDKHRKYLYLRPVPKSEEE